MGLYEKEVVNRLKTYKEIPKFGQIFNYCIAHTYDEENRAFYVESPYGPDAFEVICAYIQFECSEIEESYSIDQTEVIEVLEKFYDSKLVAETGYDEEIDLYQNWEYFCGSDVQSVECLQRDGMDEYFKRYVNQFYESHPEWKPAVN